MENRVEPNYRSDPKILTGTDVFGTLGGLEQHRRVARRRFRAPKSRCGSAAVGETGGNERPQHKPSVIVLLTTLTKAG